MQQIKYYGVELYHFCKLHLTAVLGVIILILLSMFGRKAFLVTQLQLRNRLSDAAKDEDVIRERSRAAARESVRNYKTQDKVSSKQLHKAMDAQEQAARLHLRKDPQLPDAKLLELLNND